MQTRSSKRQVKFEPLKKGSKSSTKRQKQTSRQSRQILAGDRLQPVNKNLGSESYRESDRENKPKHTNTNLDEKLAETATQSNRNLYTIEPTTEDAFNEIDLQIELLRRQVNELREDHPQKREYLSRGTQTSSQHMGIER